jgi:hypothetical protein
LGDTFFIWGAQLEAGSNATSYIPTVASTVTRNADVISKTGISSLIGQTEGTLYAEVDLANGFNQDIIRVSFDNTFSDTIIFRKTAINGLEVFIRINSVTIFLFSFASFNGRNKVAFNYKSGNSSLFINGNKVASNTLTFTTNSNYNTFNLGNFNNTTNICSGKINSALIFKTQLTDTECINLTTL